MKIAVFNPYQGRFLKEVTDNWSQQHEVKTDRYYDPELVLWADVSIFFTTDNNIKSATNPSQAILDDKNNFFPWDLHEMDLTGKKIVVVPVDIEVWYGHQHGVLWDVVTDVVFIAPHIKDLMMDVIPDTVNVHLCPLGVDTDKFDFIDKPVGKKIAWVCEKWPTKGIDFALQIMAMLPKDYELHTIGGWNERYSWEEAYQKDFIKRHDIKFFDYDFVPDQNEWLADKDYILSCSKKEAFGYSIAEGMSKGLIPVIHRFFGCSELWDVNVWDTVDEAVRIIELGQISNKRREYRDELFAKGYDLYSLMLRLDEIINA